MSKAKNNEFKKSLKFYKNKENINRIIKRDVRKKGQIIHGSRALNKQLNPILRTPPRDFDVFSKNPGEAARLMEKKLDKKFGGDFFSVKKGTNPKVKTRKVVSNITESSVVDYTRPNRKITHKKINGTKYTDFKHFRTQIAITLKDPASEFRFKKDRETLKRIRLQEQLNKRKANSFPTIFRNTLKN